MDSTVPSLLKWIRALWHALGTAPAPAASLTPRTLPAYAALARYRGNATELEPRLRLMATQLAAERSRCRWCIDKGRHVWREAQLPLDLLRALLQFETSPLFAARERAALRFADALTRFRESDGDATLVEPLAAVRQHLSDQEVAALTAAVAEMHFYNPITGVLGAGGEGGDPEERKRPARPSVWGAPIGTSVRSFWL